MDALKNLSGSFAWFRSLEMVGVTGSLCLGALLVYASRLLHYSSLGTGADCVERLESVTCAVTYSLTVWPCGNYLLGVLTLLSTLAWTLVYREEPAKHPNLSGVELNRLLERKILR